MADMSKEERFKKAFDIAILMLCKEQELEIRSGLKEAGRIMNIPYGNDMGEFVQWAEKELNLQ